MKEKLRFTGENPPPRLWARYPNWENAYDEEGLPDQDETTLRPSDDQQAIGEYVSWTVADVAFANGKTTQALLGIIDGEAHWIYVYPQLEQESFWFMVRDSRSGRWQAQGDEYSLDDEDFLPVPTSDSDVYPLRVTSRLPLRKSGEKISFEIIG